MGIKQIDSRSMLVIFSHPLINPMLACLRNSFKSGEQYVWTYTITVVGLYRCYISVDANYSVGSHYFFTSTSGASFARFASNRQSFFSVLVMDDDRAGYKRMGCNT